MTRFDRRAFIKTTGLLGVAGLTGLAGCTGGPGGGDSTETTTAEQDTSERGGSTGTTTAETTPTTQSTETASGTGTSAAESTGTTAETSMSGSNDTGTTAESQTPAGNDSMGNDSTGNDSAGNDSAATTGTGGTSTGTTYVGMVYATGGLGDGSFNDQAQQGIKQAKSDLNVQYNQAQPDEVSQFSNFQQQFASSTDPNYDLVTCVGYLQADALKETAPNYPDQKFQIIDDSSVKADNVASYVFREHEGSFLAGVLAAMLTSTSFEAGAGKTKPDEKSVGFVGGVEGALIGRFEAGFKSGVKHTNSDVEVQTTYVGDFNDPSGGKEAANAMYSSGADIVYHAAGNTGTGVFQAAQSKGRYAIGVDRDQSKTRPDYKDVILASVVKRVDTAVYNAVKATRNGTFKGGEATTLGLQEDGVALVYGQQLGSKLPEDIKSAVSDTRQSIIDGDIDVPTDPSNV